MHMYGIIKYLCEKKKKPVIPEVTIKQYQQILTQETPRTSTS